MFICIIPVPVSIGGMVSHIHYIHTPSPLILSSVYLALANLVKLIIYRATVNRIMMCSCPEEKLAVEIWERKRAGHGQHRTNSIPSRHIQSIQVPQSASEHKEKRSFDLRSAGGKGGSV